MMRLAIGAGAVLVAVLAAAGPAHAQANVMKECGAKYQAAKANKTLPAGQTWGQYLAACRGTAKPAAAAPASATASAPAAKPAPGARTPGARTPGQVAEASRQKQCGAQWRADKAANKTGSQTWPQYWSACSKRLKG